MGQRGEIFSTRIFMDEGKKTFFFNVKENRFRDRYINIVESRKTDSGFKRSGIVVFEENIAEFKKSLGRMTSSLQERKFDVIEKLSVGGGRRSYELKVPPKGKKGLQIIESREDATGKRRESIIIPIEGITSFMDGFAKADAVLESN